MKEAFENYVKKYNMKDPDIEYKYKHSYRVMALAKDLAIKLELNEKDIELATIIGLYHDIGRFEEDKRFDSFGIHNNFDHGDYGRDVLLKENVIKDIPIENKYYKLIGKAVETHNKYAIEEGLDKKTNLHCKIIRDADKIDIIWSASKGIMTKKAFNEKAKAIEMSEEVKKQFYNNVQIIKRKKSKHSDANKVISLLALVYDINFDESIKYLVENKIIDNLYEFIEDKEGYKKYFNHIKEYLEKRYKNVRN